MGRPAKIAIQSCGSRGDCQPMIALGVALKKAGYKVHIVTNVNHLPMITESGLEGEGVFFDSEKELQEDKALMDSMNQGDFATFLKGWNNLMERHMEEHLTKWFAAIERIKPDLILSGMSLQVLGAIAERIMRIPAIDTTVTVYCPENPAKMVMGLPNLPCGLNKFLIKTMIVGGLYSGMQKYDPVCKKLKGYQPCDLYTIEDLQISFYRPTFGALQGSSPIVARTLHPGPVPANVKLCGYWSTESQIDIAQEGKEMYGDAATVDAVKRFIAAGSKPVFMGWGSMTAKSPEYMVELVARAVKFAGARAIVDKGWADLGLEMLKKATDDKTLIEYTEQNLLFVGKTPHEWLFPQVSCIVHHGGAGTMATAARSGTPQIITPVFLDQWDHARFLNEYGAGFGFEKTQLTKLGAKELGEAIQKVETSEQIKAKAAEWGEAARAENGCQKVVEHVEWFWSECVETGKWEQHITSRLDEIKQSRSASRCCC